MGEKVEENSRERTIEVRRSRNKGEDYSFIKKIKIG